MFRYSYYFICILIWFVLSAAYFWSNSIWIMQKLDQYSQLLVSYRDCDAEAARSSCSNSSEKFENVLKLTIDIFSYVASLFSVFLYYNVYCMLDVSKLRPKFPFIYCPCRPIMLLFLYTPWSHVWLCALYKFSILLYIIDHYFAQGICTVTTAIYRSPALHCI